VKDDILLTNGSLPVVIVGSKYKETMMKDLSVNPIADALDQSTSDERNKEDESYVCYLDLSKREMIIPVIEIESQPQQQSTITLSSAPGYTELLAREVGEGKAPVGMHVGLVSGRD
jgi:hypothetical protein